MTVRVGTSVVAGSGADAQEVNSLIESVNALTAKVEELTKKLESGSLGGSGNLSEKVELALIFSYREKLDSTGNLVIDSDYEFRGSSYIAHNRAYVNVNGVNYYSQLVGKPYFDDYGVRDQSIVIEVPRGSLIVVDAATCIKGSGSYAYIYSYNTKTCVANDHQTLIFRPVDKHVV